MKRLMLSVIAAAGLLLASCTKSDIQQYVTGEPNALPVSVSFAAAPHERPGSGANGAAHAKTVVAENEALTITFGEAGTKATELTTAEDSKITSVWVMQYDGAGNILGEPQHITNLPAPAPGTTGIDATYVASPNLTTCTDPNGKVYFLANISFPFTKNDVATIAKLEANFHAWSDEYAVIADQVRMVGVYTGTVNATSQISNVPLKRLAAKVIFRYKVAAGFSEFKPHSVTLNNVSNKVYFRSEPTAVFPAPDANSHSNYGENVNTSTADGEFTKYVWYIPENLRDLNGGVTDVWDRTLDKTDGMATYIEIKGATSAEIVTYNILLGDLSKSLGDFNVKRNTVYAVTVELHGVNPSDNRIEAKAFDINNSAIVVPNSGNAGAVTFNIRKCLHNGFTSEAALKAMMGAGSTLTADVLWQDGNVINTADIKLDKDNGLLTVKSSKATVGNAVVALYPNAAKNQGDILWSWHVWVTDYAPDGTKNYGLGTNSKADVAGGQVHAYGAQYVTKNPGKVIMDRNLGATKTYYAAPAANDASADQSFGMFYQWGRKDPLPRAKGSTIIVATSAGTTIPIYGADGTTVLPEDGTGYKKIAIATAISGVNTLAYSTENPLAFIYSLATPFDWYTDAAANQNNALWGDGAAKSAYDPCPAGWRVPKDGTWNDFGVSSYADPFYFYINGVKQTALGAPAMGSYATNGRLYNSGATNLAWYPAPGYRHDATGALASAGAGGYCWSSTAKGINAAYLNFFSSTVDPSEAYYRTRGRQVRCIQE